MPEARMERVCVADYSPFFLMRELKENLASKILALLSLSLIHPEQPRVIQLAVAFFIHEALPLCAAVVERR